MFDLTEYFYIVVNDIDEETSALTYRTRYEQDMVHIIHDGQP